MKLFVTEKSKSDYKSRKLARKYKFQAKEKGIKGEENKRWYKILLDNYRSTSDLKRKRYLLEQIRKLRAKCGVYPKVEVQEKWIDECEETLPKTPWRINGKFLKLKTLEISNVEESKEDEWARAIRKGR